MTKNSYTLYSKAANDIERIVDWYEQLSPGLSILFLNELELRIIEIAKNPEAYKLVTSGIRRCLLKQFPYIVYFIFESNFVVVLRVRNKRQKQLKRYT